MVSITYSPPKGRKPRRETIQEELANVSKVFREVSKRRDNREDQIDIEELLDTIVQELYYDDKITTREVRQIVGPEKAEGMKVLKSHLNRPYLDDLAEE